MQAQGRDAQGGDVAHRHTQRAGVRVNVPLLAAVLSAGAVSPAVATAAADRQSAPPTTSGARRFVPCLSPLPPSVPHTRGGGGGSERKEGKHTNMVDATNRALQKAAARQVQGRTKTEARPACTRHLAAVQRTGKVLYPSRIPTQPLAASLNQRPAGKDRMHVQAWITGESQAIPSLPSALPEPPPPPHTITA